MGITSYDWGPWLQNEALKFWFYGIAVSLLLGYYQLLLLSLSSNKTPAPTGTEPTDEKSPKIKDGKSASPSSEQAAQKAEEDKVARGKILTQLAIDHCDIFLPGSAVGWIPADEVGVGLCQSISSALSMPGIWERVVMAG